jgi:ADP-ribose pyrophosphatase YjhB (NUDIX family)
VKPPLQAEPVDAVGAVVVDDAGRVLLVRRGRPPRVGSWTLPGGRLEPGETRAAAVAREVLEETAVDAVVVCDLGAVDVQAEGFAYRIHEHLLRAREGSPSPQAGDDAADARWATRDDAHHLGVRADALAVIDRGLAEARSRALIPG